MFAILAAPAVAGEGLGCAGDGVNVHLPLGAGPGLMPLGAEITIGDTLWSTDAPRTGGTPVMVGQSFGDDEILRVDFTDDQLERVVIKLRLVVGVWGDEPVIAGILWHEEAGAFALTCY